MENYAWAAVRSMHFNRPPLPRNIPAEVTQIIFIFFLVPGMIGFMTPYCLELPNNVKKCSHFSPSLKYLPVTASQVTHGRLTRKSSWAGGNVIISAPPPRQKIVLPTMYDTVIAQNIFYQNE